MRTCGALRCTTVLESGKGPGLGDVLAGRCTADDVVVAVKNIPHLSVVSSGTEVSYPAEALASEAMTAALRRWRNVYDHIVIDTPPVSDGDGRGGAGGPG